MRLGGGAKAERERTGSCNVGKIGFDGILDRCHPRCDLRFEILSFAQLQYSRERASQTFWFLCTSVAILRLRVITGLN